MKNFKMKDLMITIQPQTVGSNALYNCEPHSKPGDTTGCTNCTHQTSGDETNCTNCTHQTVTDGTGCTNCTHQTTVTCKPHSKPEQLAGIKLSQKAAELNKLKKDIVRLQEEVFA
jgi:hypothetical protein